MLVSATKTGRRYRAWTPASQPRTARHAGAQTAGGPRPRGAGRARDAGRRREGGAPVARVDLGQHVPERAEARVVDRERVAGGAPVRLRAGGPRRVRVQPLVVPVEVHPDRVDGLW